jgi:hypothetical protein
MVLKEMRVRGREHDLIIQWNSEDHEDVASARKIFSDLIAKGYAACRVHEREQECDEHSKFITEFDPEAGALILFKPAKKA